jgi:hypothetical protein
VLGCIEVPPSSSRPTAAFAPQLLLPTCRAISASPPPLGSRSARTWPPPNSSRAVRSAAELHPLPSPRRPPTFSTRDSTAPWAAPPRIIVLQHLLYCVRPSCTPIRSWPERVQRRHRYALDAVVLHAVALHSSSFSCCRSRTHLGLAASHLYMSEPRASLTRSHFAGLASLLPRLAFRRTPWLHPRYGHYVPASAHARLYVVVLLGHLSSRTAPARTARVPLTPPVRAAKSCAYTHACSAPRCSCAPFAACCPHSSTCRAHSSTCRARQSRAPTLLLRPPNTCTRHQLPHARSLLPPEPAPPGLARHATLRQCPQPELPATYPALRRALAPPGVARRSGPCTTLAPSRSLKP